MTDSPDTSNPIQTDVILVIKGAGNQEVDATLHEFLGGFFPAMRKFDPDAKLRIGRESTIFGAYAYQRDFEEFDQKIAEITTQNGKGEPHRIWIKEVYWEPLIRAPGALKSIFSEWDLTSFSLRKTIQDLLYPWQNGRRYDRAGREIGDLNAHKHTAFSYWLYFFIAHFLILTFLGLLGLWTRPLLETGLEVVRNPAAPLGVQLPFGQYLLFAAAAAAVASLGPGIASARSHAARSKLPGLGGWVLWLLAAGMLFQPGSYVLLLLAYFIFGVVLLVLARRLCWPYRPNWYTDTPVTYHLEKDSPLKHLDQRFSRLARGNQFAYRLFTVLGVPTAILILVLSKGFRVLNLFNALGTRIDAAISNFVDRFLGDVTAYALDPVQASVVQSIVEANIRTFVDLTAKATGSQPAVSAVHLFAHSQGTPITYEVYFHLLDGPYRRKVRSLLTIGSVLNLHNLVNEVLDEAHWSRFPPADLPPDDTIHGGFKWFNFWNFTDPITQFVGLEAYRHADLKTDEAGNVEFHPDGTPELKFHKASPFSIKTRDSLVKNHSEYWSNVDEIHYPFIKHILRADPKKWLPDEWLSPFIRQRQEAGTWKDDDFDPADYESKKRRHRILLAAAWLLLAAGAVTLGIFFRGPFSAGIAGLLGAAGAGIGAVFGWLASLLSPERLAEQAGLWAQVKALYLSQEVVNLTGLVLVGLGVLSRVTVTVPE